jgi:hypothetical protein
MKTSKALPSSSIIRLSRRFDPEICAKPNQPFRKFSLVYLGSICLGKRENGKLAVHQGVHPIR